MYRLLAGEARTEKNSASAKQKKAGTYLQAREPSKRAEFFLGSCFTVDETRRVRENLTAMVLPDNFTITKNPTKLSAILKFLYLYFFTN